MAAPINRSGKPLSCVPSRLMEVSRTLPAWHSSNAGLTGKRPRFVSLEDDRQPLPFSCKFASPFHAVVTQAPQHVRPYETQAIWDSRFAPLPLPCPLLPPWSSFLVISLISSMSRAAQSHRRSLEIDAEQERRLTGVNCTHSFNVQYVVS